MSVYYTVYSNELDSFASILHRAYFVKENNDMTSQSLWSKYGNNIKICDIDHQ